MKKNTNQLLIFILQFGLFGAKLSAVMGGENEPVRYIGKVKTSNSDYKNGYYDGQMRPAIGVQNYQILRANRTHPEWSDGLGWTYNHAPMLAYFNSQFYCEYLTNPTGEHIPPGVTMLSHSADGIPCASRYIRFWTTSRRTASRRYWNIADGTIFT